MLPRCMLLSVLVSLFACGGDPFMAAVEMKLTADAGAGDAADTDGPTSYLDGPNETLSPDTGHPHDSGVPGVDAAPCTGSCIDVPAGWTLVEAAFSSSAPPACGPNFNGPSTLLYDGLNAPDPTCSCSCGPATGIECYMLTAPACNNGGTCQYNCGADINLGSTCTALGSGGGQVGGTPTATGGSCSPQSSVSVPPTSWDGQARLCAPGTLDACGPQGSGTCAPDHDPGFALCIEQSGDVSCPSLWPTKHTEYTGVDDTRACTACTCGTPGGITCGGQIDCYTDQACTVSTGPIGGACSTPGCPYAKYNAQPTGSCTPGGGQPTGSAQTTGATTVCCR